MGVRCLQWSNVILYRSFLLLQLHKCFICYMWWNLGTNCGYLQSDCIFLFGHFFLCRLRRLDCDPVQHNHFCCYFSLSYLSLFPLRYCLFLETILRRTVSYVFGVFTIYFWNNSIASTKFIPLPFLLWYNGCLFICRLWTHNSCLSKTHSLRCYFPYHGNVKATEHERRCFLATNVQIVRIHHLERTF